MTSNGFAGFAADGGEPPAAAAAAGSGSEPASRLRRFWVFIAAHIRSVHVGLLLLEFVLTLVVILYDPRRMTHFTWWGIAAYGVYAGAAVFFSPAAADFLWGVSAVTSTVVFVGVLCLSGAGCTLLQDALDDLGGSGYLLGNFAVHYWPLLRLCHSRPPLLPPRFWNQTLYALTFPLAYLSVMQASDVYGCRIPEDAVVHAAPALAFVPVALRWALY